MKLPFGGHGPVDAAAGAFAAVEHQSGDGDVVRRQIRRRRRTGKQVRLGRSPDQHGVAFEDLAQLARAGIGDLLPGRAGQQPPRQAGNGRIARRMRLRDPGLAADGSGELAGGDGHHEQDDDGDDVVRVGDAEGEVGRGEEIVIGKSGRQRREQRRTEAGQDRGGKDRRQVKEVDGRIAPARRQCEADEGRGRDHERGLGIAAEQRDGPTIAGGKAGHGRQMRRTRPNVESERAGFRRFFMESRRNPHGIFMGMNRTARDDGHSRTTCRRAGRCAG